MLLCFAGRPSRTGRCTHNRTQLSAIGSAFESKATVCLECDNTVTPCCRCLCFITKSNIWRHQQVCVGSKFELTRKGPVGSRHRVNGKFSKRVTRKQRQPGRGRTKELFDTRELVLCNTLLGGITPAWEYRNKVVVDTRANHHSAVGFSEFVDELSKLLKMNGELFEMKHTSEGRKRYRVHFRNSSVRVTNKRNFLSKVKQGAVQCVYCVYEVHDLHPSHLPTLLAMAPPPAAPSPFLFKTRFTVLFSVAPPDECFVVVPHVDKDGTGPLVIGPHCIGSVTSVAVRAPDYSRSKEPVPPDMKTVFTSGGVGDTSQSSPEVHVVNLSTRGAHINLPAGCWHAVRTYGSSIRVGYYFEHREK